MPPLDRKPIAIAWLILFCVSMPTDKSLSAELAGVTVQFDEYEDPATIHVQPVDRYKVQIDIEPKTESKPVVIRVELPITGRDAWPIADVEVLDSKGQPVPVRRSGIEWHRLLITVPPKRNTFVVHAVNPAGDRPQIRSEKERHATDVEIGVSAAICRWYDGRSAALSIRFDDSHPTHLSKAIPILNEYGFRGTFMVNPGGHLPNSRRCSAFEARRSEWESVARRGEHEFANHTLNHRGAQDDESMEREIGDAAKALWKLFPKKSKLLALNLGGGTQWVTTNTLRYYLDKYHLFDASANSTGMDDVYGKRLETFQRFLEGHIERGLWFKVHYHYIGDGLSTSEANFRAALDIAKQHQDKLWVAGMADIYKYQTERRGAKLAIENNGRTCVRLQLSCSTKPELYDQPLTLEVTLPELWWANSVMVKNDQEKVMATRTPRTNSGKVLRFEVAPRDALYSIEMIR